MDDLQLVIGAVVYECRVRDEAAGEARAAEVAAAAAEVAADAASQRHELELQLAKVFIRVCSWGLSIQTF